MSLERQIARWRQPGFAGFSAWLEDVRPMVSAGRGFAPYGFPTERIRCDVQAALDGGFSTLIWLWPRRHGKTTLSVLVLLWRWMTRAGQTLGIVANSKSQSQDTAIRMARQILERTEFTAKMIRSGAIQMTADEIRLSAVGSVIVGFPNAAAQLYGRKLGAVMCSELHAARDDAVLSVLASSLIDTPDSLLLIDSTTGPRTSPLYSLYELWRTGRDKSIFVSHVSYDGVEDAIANGPKWIDEQRLRSRAAQMLDLEWQQQHLNRWTDSEANVFSEETIKHCTMSYPLVPRDLAEGRSYSVGGGLDRAMIFSRNRDRTVLTAVAKMIDPKTDEPEFYVLASKELMLSTESAIRKTVTDFKRDFGLKHFVAERYESQDVALWIGQQGIESELVHATAQQQASAFTYLAAAASEGRLHIHPTFTGLLSEMRTFQYSVEVDGNRGATVKFQHARGHHDDHLYSLAWAIYSLREVEASPYEVAGISCDARAETATHCVLNGGQLVPLCSQECRSFQAVNKLYSQFTAKTAHPMRLGDFVQLRLKNTGAHVRRR